MKRKGHSATVLLSTPTSVEILMFGGYAHTYDTLSSVSAIRIYGAISTTTLLILGELLL